MVGRKLSFDPDVALEKMMRLLWEKGYAQTSVDDLCRTVGVPKPSLYSYFGDKEAILIQALKLYGERAAQRRKDYGSGTLPERLTKLMLSLRFEGVVEAPSPSGCFLVNMIAEFMGVSPAVDQTLAEISRLNDLGLTDFFDDARGRGELASGVESKKIAVQVNTFIKGLAVSRKAGASVRSLREQIDFFVEILTGAISPGV